MPVSFDDLVKLLAEFCENKHLFATATESLKGGMITGASAFLGGILLGPVGLALGGVIGGGIAAAKGHGKFRSVAIILREMTPAEKEKLCRRALTAFKDFHFQDVAGIALLLASNSSFQDLALKTIISFLTSEMGMQIKQGI